MQFYPHDWLSDPALRSCSLSARGLWIDMLCVMWDSPERGISPYSAGKVEAKAWAKVVGHRADFVRKLLSELEKAKVFSRRNGDRKLYSRRMTQEELVRKQHRDSYHRTRTEFGRDSDAIRNDFGRHSSSSSSSSSSLLASNGDRSNGARAVLTERENLARALFEKFWIDYPKKLDRDEAFRVWFSLSPLDQTIAVESVIVWAKSEEWSEPRFVPSPVNFLKKRRWESRPVTKPEQENLNEAVKRLEAKHGIS